MNQKHVKKSVLFILFSVIFFNALAQTDWISVTGKYLKSNDLKNNTCNFTILGSINYITMNNKQTVSLPVCFMEQPEDIYDINDGEEITVTGETRTITCDNKTIEVLFAKSTLLSNNILIRKILDKDGKLIGYRKIHETDSLGNITSSYFNYYMPDVIAYFKDTAKNNTQLLNETTPIENESPVEYVGFNDDNFYVTKPADEYPSRIVITSKELSYNSVKIAVTKCGNNSTQSRPEYLNESAKLLGNGDVSDPSKKYPLIVWLPWTGSPAERYYNETKTMTGLQNYFALLPQGDAKSSEYLPDFYCFIQWFEKRLLTDIKQIAKQYPVDTSKIYLTGFSVGGDLGWALMIRQKSIFAGAFIQGTRCSYGITTKDMKYLKDNNKKLIMLCSNRENRTRYDGMTAAAKKLKTNKVNVQHWIYRDYSASGHYIASRKDTEKAFKKLIE